MHLKNIIFYRRIKWVTYVFLESIRSFPVFYDQLT